MDHHVQLQNILGDPVMDPEEDVFLVFSQHIPSQSLGFVDSQATTLELSVSGRDLVIHQSHGLLTSNRKEGTTGAVVWKVTPLFAEWIASPNFLFDTGYLTETAIVTELGAGVSGIVALSLGPQVKRYVATDQDYAMKLLRQNIAENSPTASTIASKKSKPKRKRTPKASEQSSNIDTLELDWELDSVSSLSSFLGQGGKSDHIWTGIDLVIACDCIYNDALIEPLNNTCAQICRLRTSSQGEKPTLCLIAQQLRSPDVFESWLKSFHRLFHVWRIPEELLTPPLRENTGFVVHVGYLR